MQRTTVDRIAIPRSVLLVRAKGRTYAICQAKHFLTRDAIDVGGRALPRDNERFMTTTEAIGMIATLLGLLALCSYVIALR